MTTPADESILAGLQAEAGTWARQHLADDLVGWLTTVAPDGRVQTSPISFLWEGSTILIYSKPNAPKLRNIAAHAQVSFNLNSDPYADHALVIEGTAEVDMAVLPIDRHEAYAAKFREALAHWQIDGTEARTYSVAVRITPTRIRAW